MVGSLAEMQSTFDIVVTSLDLLNLNEVPTPISFLYKDEDEKESCGKRDGSY
jgi:hypothetical protein